MSDTTIIILVQNQLERLKLCFRTLLDFVELENTNLIISDFASKDGLSEWAQQQPDITFVSFEEGEATYGKALNEMIRELELSGDLLIMTPDFLFTPKCLKLLKNVFSRDDEIKVAGPASNVFLFQKKAYKGYEDEVIQAMQAQDADMEYVLGQDGRVLLLRDGSFEKYGDFDENLISLQKIMMDYMLRIICNDGKVAECKNSVFWGILPQNIEKSVEEEDWKYLREKWGMNYFNYFPNYSLLQMINKGVQDSFRVLEIGCDCGANLLAIKSYYPNSQVYGIEINESAAKIAGHVVKVLQGDIENSDCRFDVKFDYIVFGDVLEHLHDPLQVLMNCRKLLAEEGCIIACIPNVQHISVVEDLLNGNFTYTDTGLLDKTHIHLFTYKEILSMFEKAAYKVEHIVYRVDVITEKQRELIGKLVELSSGSTREMFESFQYVVRCRLIKQEKGEEREKQQEDGEKRKGEKEEKYEESKEKSEESKEKKTKKGEKREEEKEQNTEDGKDCDKLKQDVSHIMDEITSIKNENNLLRQSLKEISTALIDMISNQQQRDDTIDQNFQHILNGMDHLVYEAKDESDRRGLLLPKFYSMEYTIDEIVNKRKSMSRFGDGEFAIMSNQERQKFQHTDKKLADRLAEVIRSNEKGLLIGIADNYGSLEVYNQQAKQGIRFYLSDEVRRQHMSYLDLTRWYHNAYLFRPYAMFADNGTDAPGKRFQQIKRIWNQRKVIFIEGSLTRLGVGNDLFQNATQIQRIEAPAENAFDQYDEILEAALSFAKPDTLFLIALGPTAGVLAYDLYRAGYQAIDIGHMDLEYEWYLRGTGGRCEVKHKYNNEVPGGNQVEEVEDEEYLKQIIYSIV